MARRPSRGALAASCCGVLILLLGGCSGDFPWWGHPPSSCAQPGLQPLLVAELFFGRTEPDGLYVGEIEWNDFLEQIVTPAFPDGLTAFDGYGQYKSRASGLIARENVKVLEIAAPDTPATRQALGAIVAAYKQRFRQEAVFEIDRTSCAGVR